ncbi:NAD-dependent succinate-semialdehyde dehydrogenase [Paraburkholderia sediminicola]|uniref:NAD-dependent succinate-semialdehyde dehydrogenase n=1 Tax=Paraburkholderia sediminicola TaxID=458836 RepID=UPI0038BDD81B
MQSELTRYEQYINGEFRSGRGTFVADVLNPSTGLPIGTLPHASEADVKEAVDAAAQAFPSWKNVGVLERSNLLRTIASNIRARRPEISVAIATELGKPIVEARKEVEVAAEMFDWAAEEARRAYGRIIPSRTLGGFQYAQVEPIGPVAAFAGWNAPAITPSRKISGALAAGCTIVIKPSEETPGVALGIVRAAADAGLPAGVLSVVFGDPAAIADQLLAAPEIRMVSFTGATSVGKQIGEKAARTMKRATLELGGHAPVIVCDDVDVAKVAKAAALTKFRNSGQVCTSPTRFYVQEGIYENFLKAFSSVAAELRVGNSMDECVQMGPVKNKRRREAVERLIDDARSQGVAVVSGGTRPHEGGFFLSPTVLRDFRDECLAANEEPFGPLAMFRPFDSIDNAISMANRLPFGLASYAFTRDVARARDLSDGIDSGVVCINEWQASLPETPFGGVKDSGLGSEGGIEGLREFQRTKCVRNGTIL